ncbi:TPA: hypothetical protein DIS56_00380 [Candidatus Saccharibacteria bacterium]|nr:MAG: hypothetical protein A3F05_02005 [Candidatus Saccharibacteria bacterium RIFCSPHIGHO2_12_FULL_47_17]HCM51583.1 hypothetical protein [Candidatus Saccharibacteria bacterium]
MKQKTITVGIICLLIGLGAGYYIGYDVGYEKQQNYSTNSDSTKKADIKNFEDCAAAGYPIQESYPRVCRTPDNTYTENI